MKNQRQTKPVIRNTLSYIFLVLGAIYLIIYIARYSQYPSDDAFIHMRIARNFLATGQPYYNVDQAVAGSSSVLWLLLLTAAFWLFGVNFHIVPWLTTFFTIATYMATIIVLRKYFSVLISIVISFLLTVIVFANTAALLMETPVVLLFWLLSIMCVDRKRFFFAGLFAGLSFATRYEYVVWMIIIIFLADTFKEKIVTGIGILLPAMSVAVFNLYYFSSLIPNTIRAKSIIYDLTYADSLHFMFILIPAGLCLFILLMTEVILLTWYYVVKTKQKAPAIMLVFAVVILSMYVSTRTNIFPWYVPLFLFPLVLGCCFTLTARNKLIRIVAFFILLILGTVPLAKAVQGARGLILNRLSLYHHYDSSLRVQQYLHIGSLLYEQYPHATLMAPEIGGLGWTFSGKIIDAVGIVSPECLQYHPLDVPTQRSSGTYGAIPSQAVVDLQPDLIVSMETFSEELRKDMAIGHVTGYVLLKNYPVLAESEYSEAGDAVLWNARYTQVYILK
jgi:hypothetical protein